MKINKIQSSLQKKYQQITKKWPKWLPTFLFYFILINVVYFPIYFQYFQQDEWFYLSYFHQFPFTPQGAWGAFTAVFFDPQPFSYHLTPLGTLFRWIEFTIFGITFPLYALLSLLLHTINSYLVYRFTQRITQNNFVSFLAGIFFAVTFSHSQAVTWMAAHLETQTACLFALLSMNYFFDFLQVNNRRKYLLSIVFFLCSVLIKETGVFLIIFLPLLTVLYKSFRSLRNLKLFYLSAIVYLIFRILTPPLIAAITHTKTISGIATQNNDIFFSVYYTITFLLKAFSESFFPLSVLNQLSMTIADFGYKQYTAEKSVWGTDYVTFIQSAGLDIALYLTSFLVILIFIGVMTHFSIDKVYKKSFYISICLIGLSILPLTFLAGWLLSLFFYISIIESRHLYITSIGISVLFGFLIYWMYKRTEKRHILTLSLKYLFILPLIIWIGYQAYIIAHDPSTDSKTATDRKAIVNTFLNEKPRLEKKTVFYSESNVALYGFADYMLPFQNNPAQVIVGTYGGRQSLPEGFYTKDFLFKKLTEEWYQKYEDVELGYYLNKKHFLQAVIEKDIKPENIVALTYDGREHKVINSTEKIRSEVKNYLQKRAEFKDWKFYEDKKYQYAFFYPQGYVVEKETPKNENIISTISMREEATGELFFTLEIYPVAEGMGVTNLVETLTDDSGELVGKNYRTVLIPIGPTDKFTSELVTSNVYETHSFKTLTNKEIKRFTLPREDQLTDEKKELRRRFLEVFEFNN